MNNRLEIKLTEANNQLVSLKSMSPEAMDSFMTVMSALKTIAVSVNTDDKLVFSISEGSAQCAIEAPEDTMKIIYDEVDIAIKGKSEDKEITVNLRRIQEQLMREGYNYKFIYKRGRDAEIDIHSRLIRSSKIKTKRSKKLFEYKVRVVSGFLNQIGGKEPNYHFDYGHGEKKTIVCSKEEAMQIKQYLYKNVNVLLVCKEWSEPEKRNEYYHKLIIEGENVYKFKQFLNSYNKENNLVEKLILLHNFIDEEFEANNDSHDILMCLLIAFNDKNFHLSELKTLLVISKPFKEHKLIKVARNQLLETYQAIKSK